MTLRPLIPSVRSLPPHAAQKLLEIQDEIIRIDVHRIKHLEPDPSCKYCNMNFDGIIRKDLEISDMQKFTEPDEAKDVVIRKEISRPPVQFNDLERIVDDAGKRGQIVVPRKWVGRRVRVILL